LKAPNNITQQTYNLIGRHETRAQSNLRGSSLSGQLMNVTESLVKLQKRITWMRKVSNDYEAMSVFVALFILGMTMPVIQFSIFQKSDGAQIIIELSLLFFELTLVTFTSHEFGHAVTAKIKRYKITAIRFFLIFPVEVEINPYTFRDKQDAMLILRAGTWVSILTVIPYTMFVLGPVCNYGFLVFAYFVPAILIILPIWIMTTIFLMPWKDRKMLKEVMSQKC